MTVLERIEELKETVKLGDIYRSARDRMKVTAIDERGITLGAGERYTWAELRRYITIGAVRQEFEDN